MMPYSEGRWPVNSFRTSIDSGQQGDADSERSRPNRDTVGRLSFDRESSLHAQRNGPPQYFLGHYPSSEPIIALPTLPTTDPSSQEAIHCIVGWKLVLLLLGFLSLAIFLPNLEISIVSTSLVAITDDLHGFSRTGWIVVAYLITYTGFIIIWAKLSDILTRKWSLVASLSIFIAASGACGGAQTMTELIVLRTIQGIGAAGCFSISMIVFFELIPKEKYAKYGSIISADIALATVLGPLLGGVIIDSTTWRWVFLLNVPAGAIAIALLGLLLPSSFPHQGKSSTTKPRIFSKQSMQRVDFLGTFLLIGANLTLVTALLEASTTFSWSSPLIIALLAVSGVLWIAFVAWEWFATKERSRQEPVFPFRFFHNRYWMGMLLQSAFVGVPFTVLVVDLPQRFQTVNNLSALDAGVRLLPYAIFAPLGSLVSNIIFMRRKSPLILLGTGASLQLVGLVLLATLPISASVPAAQYGYQIIAGFGVGISFGTLVTITPSSVEPRDLATATGAMIQFRQMGGAIGLTIGSSLLNSYLKTHLATPVLNPDQMSRLLQSTTVIRTFSPQLQVTVREVFARGYNLQMKVITGFAAAQFPSISMMLKLLGWRELRIVNARQ